VEVWTDYTNPFDASDDGTRPYGDDDGDGLLNVYERHFGTDPLVADTDGGGESDGAELYELGSNPLDGTDDAVARRDTDGDGLRDLTELHYGTDPTLADTDGGGVDDYTELYIDGTFPTDASDDGQAPWGDDDGDGLPNSYEAFYGTDRNVADTDGGGVNDGVEVFQNGSNPLDGSDDLAFTIDTDGDGLSDGQELFNYGTDPTLADTDGGGVDDYTELFIDGTSANDASDDGQNPWGDDDGDGLPNSYESFYGTDRNLADTDGGGVNDGLEVSQGTNPVDGDDDGSFPDANGNGVPDFFEGH